MTLEYFPFCFLFSQTTDFFPDKRISPQAERSVASLGPAELWSCLGSFLFQQVSKQDNLAPRCCFSTNFIGSSCKHFQDRKQVFPHASLGRMKNKSLPGASVHDIFNDCYFLIRNTCTLVVESNQSGFVIRSELLK